MSASLVRFHNSLYLTRLKTWLVKEGETLVVRTEGKEVAAIPVHHLGSVVCLVPVHVTPDAMYLCLQRQVSVVFLNFGGRFLGRVEGPIGGNVLLRKRQFQLSEAGWPEGVRGMLLGKLKNARALLRRATVSSEKLDQAIQGLKRAEGSLAKARDVAALRGVEGTGARLYFAVFDSLLTAKGFRFEKRHRRPPLNPVNALLSFGYGLLRAECIGALEAVGLDPAVGFLHVDRPGRPSLALDLMEEFRPARVDRFVVAMINRGQVQKRDFHFHPNGAVAFKEPFRKSFLQAWQARKQETTVHPTLGLKVSQAMLVHLQARLLARTIRGELSRLPRIYLEVGKHGSTPYLISYDIGETKEKAGQKRLRRVARLCKNVGQRVQFSVFEVQVSATQWTQLRLDLLATIQKDKDSLRFYFWVEVPAKSTMASKKVRTLKDRSCFRRPAKSQTGMVME